ncbi:hypothetical protein SDRG_03377 [Saprolegnia diclina VS20]|uniref:peptidylprolyl isomerase n=1 Tax=Saprolegnia diclina (strain VS20) TaxID=1156394 RepID=T0QWV4_SAPDV|nr:hypothetical protein SDRG_03377 [Saprolegnia diclina VS20]EQC39171.1 hypothetical protein SDRG_03377 [Saprolegnia diclina VS20]|eukprot:XP_008607232.1 hypothetical protein SDRG_03377 [Saprolegnia diclina VS20]
MAMTSSACWEKVPHLSPTDELQMQLEAETQRLSAAQASVTSNAQGIDVVDGKVAGALSITVLNAEDLHLDGILDLSDDTTVVGSLAIAAASIEKAKTNIRAAKTSTIRLNPRARRATWFKADQTTITFTGVKTKAASVTLTLHHPSPLVADVFVGTCKLTITDAMLADQKTHIVSLPLEGPPGHITNISYGQVQVAMRFEYDVVARLQTSVHALADAKARLDADAEVYAATAALLQAETRHPAAYGTAAAASTVYIPGHKFSAETYHPAAVARTPIADGAKVSTPFGNGTIVTFREATKMYVVLMEASPGMTKRTTTAYLRTDSVWEAPPPSRFRKDVAVTTPYGKGVVVSTRPADKVVVVKTDYGTLFLQEKDVTVEALTAKTMTNTERIAASVAASAAGNDHFKAADLVAAIEKYLESLSYLNHVDQDSASHKEKATVLQTMIRCHLNLGACKLKLGDYNDAWTACTNALSILQVLSDNRHGKVAEWMGRIGMTEALIFQEWPSKALFRRATALVAMGNDVEAKQDLLIAVKLMPKDKACRSLLESVAKRVAEAKEKEKEKWGGFLLEQNATANTKPSTAKPTTTTPAVKTRDLPGVKKPEASTTWTTPTTLAVAASVLGVVAITAMVLTKRQ